MKIDRKTFVKELDWVLRMAEKKTTIPILANTLISAQGGALTLITTDLEVSGISRIEVDSDESWAVCVPTQKIAKYLKKVEDATVELLPEIEERDATPKPTEEVPEPVKAVSLTTALKVAHGIDGEVKVEGLDPQSFPVIPLAAPVAYLAGLDVAVPRALVSISQEESRFTLNGALLVIEEGGAGAHLVATDGHRLVLVDIQAAYSGPALKTIIGKRALAEASLLDGGKVFMGLNEEFHVFTNGKRTIVSRKLKGNFPDYERVIPKELSHSVEFEPESFMKVLDRVDLFADERSHAMHLTIGNGKVQAFAETIGGGSSKGSVPATGTNGTVDELGFNITYFQDFLGLAKKTHKAVKFEYKDKATAGMLSIPGFKYVVMPMKV